MKINETNVTQLVTYREAPKRHKPENMEQREDTSREMKTQEHHSEYP